jgi:TM2 domain-containing membrane protein YozV
MNCRNHVEEQATYACSCCGAPLCVQCTVELNKKVYCKVCLEKELAKVPVEHRAVRYPRKSKFLAFCFGLIPGAGHMYLGLLTKGLLLMAVFFFTLSFAITSYEFLGIDWLPGLLIPTVCVVNFFYSIFDCLAKANEINAGQLVRDINFSEVMPIVERVLAQRRGIGFGLVIIGCISILNIFSDLMESFFARYFDFHFSLTSVVVPVLLIMFGLYLLQKGSKKGNI